MYLSYVCDCPTPDAAIAPAIITAPHSAVTSLQLQLQSRHYTALHVVTPLSFTADDVCRVEWRMWEINCSIRQRGLQGKIRYTIGH
jgi:hypothetical protein